MSGKKTANALFLYLLTKKLPVLYRSKPGLVTSILLLVMLLEALGIAIRYFLRISGYAYEFFIDSFLILAPVIPLLLLTFNLMSRRRNTERELEKSRERYRSVVNNVKEVIFQTDSEGLWIFLNPAWTEITQFGIDESLGRSFLNFVHPEDREKNLELFKPLINREKEYCRHEIRYLTKDGNFRWVEVFARRTEDAAGNLIGTSGTIRDTTVRKQMEEELIKKDCLLEGIADAANILLKTTDYSAAFNKAMEILGKAAEADRVRFFQFHPHPETGEKVFSLHYEWCSKDTEPQLQNPMYQCIPGVSPLIQSMYREHSRGYSFSGLTRDLTGFIREIFEFQQILSFLTLPIFVDNEFTGFIQFDNCPTGNSWSKIEEAALYGAASSIGSALKRMQAEKALQKVLQNDFQQILKNLQNFVFKLKRKDNGSLYMTLCEGKKAAEFKITTEDIRGKEMDEFLPPMIVERLQTYGKKAFQGEFTSFELVFPNKTIYNTLSPIFEDNEVVEVVGSAVDITELKQAEEQIRFLAYYDPLTGLPNRIQLNDYIRSCISRLDRNKDFIVIMFLDLDRFKVINDTLGHATGDSLLKEAAARLRQSIGKNNMVSRTGGDEFVVVFPEIRNERTAAALAEKVVDLFREPFIIEGHELFITTSVGISLCPFDGEDMETLIKNADTAMYRAKENGRNNYQFYTMSMNAKALEKLRIENNLRKALEKEEFILHYQPQIDAVTGEITGSEALLRWVHPELGLVSPADIIPLAEETGLIIPIGDWVLYAACLQNKSWQEKFGILLNISVNVSARQFRHQNFVGRIAGILKTTGLDPSCLIIEITENSIMHHTEKILASISQLKAMGVKIAIDDFGTGFSSLSYLKQFSMDILKIDKSFIHDITMDQNDSVITTAIINMAHTLNMRVVAEGVETREQLDFLRIHDCDEIQGYYFSKPLSVKDFENLLVYSTSGYTAGPYTTEVL